MKFSALIVLLILFVSCKKQGCTDETASNYNSLAKKDDGSCQYNEACTLYNTVSHEMLPLVYDYTADSWSNSFVEFTSGQLKEFTVNQIPNHNYGTSPNSMNEVYKTYSITISPTQSGTVIKLLGESSVDWIFGIALNGITFDPETAAPFTDTTDGSKNWNWVLEAVNNASQFELDSNHAHLRGDGTYHYHGDFNAYANTLGIDGSSMVQCGWAADGFPIYYKYAYSDPNSSFSSIVEMKSGYSLQTGERNGNGTTAPCGTFNGRYQQDYTYSASTSELDECNGRYGVTPEFPAGTYYYLITDDYPYIPRCFYGTPHTSFAR